MSVKSFIVPTSLCSPQTFIVIIILLYVYLTLENSISLHQKIIAQQKKTSETNHLPLPLPLLPPPPAPTHHHHLHQTDDHQLHEYSLIQAHKLTSPPPPPPSLDFESLMIASIGNFYDDFNITWGDGRGKISESGNSLTLSLDRFSGSGFQSKKQFLFAKISIQMKLVANNSAGTVTTYYLSSDKGDHHDEIDFEFLGNLTGQPYTLHTNIYSRGIGDREQQFYLWFDPTADFHTYSILWNPSRIVFYVDGIPIREFANAEDEIGVPFPSRQPMSIFSSLWNADDWATQGGKVKTDWSLAPFVASYRNFKAKGCVWIPDRNTTSCDLKKKKKTMMMKKKASYDDDDDQKWLEEELDATEREKIWRVQKEYMTYDYCKDVYRFPKGLPTECKPRQ